MSAPIYDRLINYHKQNRISFAMPGHKNGRGLRADLLNCDVTELDATDNLHNPKEAVKEAKERLSNLFGSDESFIVTCGSTTCIQAMIAASLKPGGTLLAAADCHMSVINACSLMGVKLKFIPREIDSEFLVAKPLSDIEPFIDGADAVIITSPTYYGVCSDVKAIAKTCHGRGIPLLVDEAHGAHFTADNRFPSHASAQGADAVCQSAHKTLNALTGAAFLHIKGGLINREKIRKALTMTETSSPSYVIAASADLAREELERGGWDKIIDECQRFKTKIESELRIKTLKNDDPTRLVLNFGAYETTGFDVSAKLAEKYGIDVEMADLVNIVLIATAWNSAEDFEKLYSALTKITSELDERKTPVPLIYPPAVNGVISPSAAFFCDTETVPLSGSAGKVSAKTVTPYPPGIPVIYAGGVITKEQVGYIELLKKAGAEITGIENGNIEIVDEENL